MKKIITGLLAAALITMISGAAMAENCNFIASKGSDKYHKPDCATVQKIKAENKLCYKYAEEAISDEFTSCGACKPAEHTKVVASKGSDKYHLPECSIVKNIKPENLQTFDSPEEAVKAGSTTPCGVCKPPKPVEKKEKTEKAEKPTKTEKKKDSKKSK
ncbi:MAG: hypothetical protein HQL24_04515 [Candidatus Omnitrophica bacterium]|nr:hypothetical protein [Candidatus Omnitrophota bacterium]